MDNEGAIRSTAQALAAEVRGDSIKPITEERKQQLLSAMNAEHEVALLWCEIMARERGDRPPIIRSMLSAFIPAENCD